MALTGTSKSTFSFLEWGKQLSCLVLSCYSLRNLDQVIAHEANQLLNSWLAATQQHYSLFENLEKDELWRYGFDMWDGVYRRVSISAYIHSSIFLFRTVPRVVNHVLLSALSESLSYRSTTIRLEDADFGMVNRHDRGDRRRHSRHDAHALSR